MGFEPKKNKILLKFLYKIYQNRNYEIQKINLIKKSLVRIRRKKRLKTFVMIVD